MSSSSSVDSVAPPSTHIKHLAGDSTAELIAADTFHHQKLELSLHFEHALSERNDMISGEGVELITIA